MTVLIEKCDFFGTTVRNVYFEVSLLMTCAVIIAFYIYTRSYSTYSHLCVQFVKIRFVVNALAASPTPNHRRRARRVIVKTF